MKKQPQSSKKTTVACCSRRQKIWGIIALLGLFTCGFMIGMTMGHRAAVDDQKSAETVHVAATDDQPACAVVEEVLLGWLAPENGGDYRNNLANAEIYSRLVDKGCPENAARYRDLALRQLEIADALGGNSVMDESETEIIIDTYKKLDMKREAQEFLNKVQRLTDPAIDFIMQMQKIINE